LAQNVNRHLHAVYQNLSFSMTSSDLGLNRAEVTEFFEVEHIGPE